MSARSRGVAVSALVLLLAPVRAAAPEVLVPGTEPTDPDVTVHAWLACRKVSPPPKDCAALRSAAVEILTRDFKSLGAGGNFAPLPVLLKALRGPEPELRAASADAIGMIGPRATETAALAAAFNDPVPAVRLSAQLALGASNDEKAKHLAARAVNTGSWKGFAADPAPAVAKLGVPVYAGAEAMRWGTEIVAGSAQLSSRDAAAKVVAFYAAKSKRKPMSLEEFEAAFSGEAPEIAATDENGQPNIAAGMEMAMKMMEQMNQQTNQGATVEQAAANIGGAQVSAAAAAERYGDESIYGAARVIVLEESELFGKANPVRFVVVFDDQTLGGTGIALHAPPVL